MLKAFDPKQTKGLLKKPDEDLLIHELEDPFLQDSLKLRQSKANRRLNSKTQVICTPLNPHVRTRGIHTNEVVALSTVISESLGLNTSLCQAIAEGHDIGHTPYGHVGENVLSELSSKKFHHYVFSVVVAQEIERKSWGLNLHFETLEGILNHSRGKGPLTTEDNLPQEYAVVMYADKIAYTFSDLNDAIRYKYLQKSNIPSYVNHLGNSGTPTKRQRIRNDACIRALVQESLEKGRVSFSESETAKQFDEFKKFMYNNFYETLDFSLHKETLKRTFEEFSKIEQFEEIDPTILVALLTDTEANHLGSIFLNTRKLFYRDIADFGVCEIAPYLRSKVIDFTDPGLDWGKR